MVSGGLNSALVKQLVERHRVFVITMSILFVYSCALSIQTCPRNKETKRPGLLRLLFKGKGDGGLRGAPLCLVVLLSMLLLPSISYSPSYPPLLYPDACIVVCVMFPVPEGLIVALFRSVRHPARLPHCVHRFVSVRTVLPRILRLLGREVDCCVPCRSTGLRGRCFRRVECCVISCSPVPVTLLSALSSPFATGATCAKVPSSSSPERLIVAYRSVA